MMVQTVVSVYSIWRLLLEKIAHIVLAVSLRCRCWKSCTVFILLQQREGITMSNTSATDLQQCRKGNLKLLDFDDDVMRCSLVDVESCTLAKTPVLAYLMRTLRSSFSTSVQASWS